MQTTDKPSTTSNRVVHAFAKNAREDVRVSLSIYKGRSIIDLRVFYRDGEGEMRPTPRGLSIDRELLPELESAVVALRIAEGE